MVLAGLVLKKTEIITT